MLKLTVAMLTIAAGLAAYAQGPPLVGDYAGVLGASHIKLHLAVAPDGKLSGAVGSGDTGILNMPCENVRVDGQTLSFSVPAVSGTWTGFVSADSNSLSGMWNQGGNPMPLTLTRISGVQNAAASGPTGANSRGEVTWDDYVFKFISGGSFVQVLQGGKLVGMVINRDGQQQVRAMPGTDAAKLQKSYEDYQAFNARGHGAAPAVTTAVATPAPVPAPTPAAIVRRM